MRFPSLPRVEMANDMSLRALVDCGASNNFVRRQSLVDRRLNFVERDIPPTRMMVRLAAGASIILKKRVVGLHYTLEYSQKHEPRVSWQHRTVKMPAACGCTASECDGLTFGTVVSTTAQYHSVTTNHTVEEAVGGCADAQSKPKVHHSKKSSGSGHGCTSSG
uniref:Uncharacterized protein n=1 Tax=Hyaloperonospora arabidopsidis (strain Emoy2) TaxID=559515 RepID=M4C3U6_HYAAE